MMDKNKECGGGDMAGMYMGKGHIWFKKIMGVAFVVMIFSFAYSAYLLASSYSESIEPSSFRSFAVSAEGKVTAIPDIAYFTFSVVTEGGKDISVLQKENTDKMNGAINFIKGNGVLAKDIKTSSYNLSPKYQYFDCGPRIYSDANVKPCPPAEIVGYSIKQTVSVKVREFSKIGDTILGVVSYGVNNVSELSFGIDDETLIQDNARGAAIKKAKIKAEMVAKAGGFRLGRLLSIETDNNNNYYIRPAVMYSKMDAIGGGPEVAPAPQVEAGSQDVVVNVTLRYEIR